MFFEWFLGSFPSFTLKKPFLGQNLAFLVGSRHHKKRNFSDLFLGALHRSAQSRLRAGRQPHEQKPAPRICKRLRKREIGQYLNLVH